MNRWRTRSIRVTAVMLVTSAVLILPGLAGLRGSIALALGFAIVSGVLFVARNQLVTLPVVAGATNRYYLTDLWVAPLLGALAIALVSDASPGELQAIGGIIGLSGMANYFVRPVYLFGISLVLPQQN